MRLKVCGEVVDVFDIDGGIGRFKLSGDEETSLACRVESATHAMAEHDPLSRIILFFENPQKIRLILWERQSTRRLISLLGALSWT